MLRHSMIYLSYMLNFAFIPYTRTFPSATQIQHTRLRRQECSVQCSRTDHVNNSRRGPAISQTSRFRIAVPPEAPTARWCVRRDVYRRHIDTHWRREGKEGSSLRMHVAGHGAWSTSMVKRRALHNVRIEPRWTIDAQQRVGEPEARTGTPNTQVSARTNDALFIVGIFAVADSRSRPVRTLARTRNEGVRRCRGSPGTILVRAEINRTFRCALIAKVFQLLETDFPRNHIAIALWSTARMKSLECFWRYIAFWDLLLYILRSNSP